MPVRRSLRWKPTLPDPAEILCEDERDERRRLAVVVFALLTGGIGSTALYLIGALL